MHVYRCRCNRFARGGNLDAEVSTSFTLQYRRGRNREDEHAVIVTSHAAAALNAAFETGDRGDHGHSVASCNDGHQGMAREFLSV
jgi:hypothetical protein